MPLLSRPMGKRKYVNAVIVGNEQKTRNGRFVVTVKSVGQEVIDETTGESQLVVRFADYPLGYILGPAKFDAIEALFGSDSDNWIGQRIELFLVPTSKGPGVRCKLPPQETSSATPTDGPTNSSGPSSLPL